MAECILPLDRETRKLFFQLGATAASDLKGVEALKMFNALEIAEPDQAYPKVGIGMLAMLLGDFQGAENYLNHPIVQSSRLATSANSFLAMAHQLNGNTSAFQNTANKIKSNSHGEYDHMLQELATAPALEVFDRNPR